ncbi:MAG: hypothetical protein AB7F98_10495 [Novosphingobium sp.]
MTFSFGRKAIVGLALAAATLAAAPAQAHNRDYRHGHDNTGAIIGAGVVGLALGAALASDRRDRYYDDYYYDDYYYSRPYAYSYGYPRGSYYRYDSYPRYYRHNRNWNHRGWNRGYRGDWGRHHGRRGHEYRRGW